MRCFPIGSLLPVLVAASFAAMPVVAEDNPWKSETFLSDYTLLRPVPSRSGQEYLYVAPEAEASWREALVKEYEAHCRREQPR